MEVNELRAGEECCQRAIVGLFESVVSKKALSMSHLWQDPATVSILVNNIDNDADQEWGRLGIDKVFSDTS